MRLTDALTKPARSSQKMEVLPSKLHRRLKTGIQYIVFCEDTVVSQITVR